MHTAHSLVRNECIILTVLLLGPEVHKPSFAFILPKGKTLRNYQKELAAPGLEGQNYIVCAPTGTGKTLIASMVISSHLEKKAEGKVIFLVNKIALAAQQCNEIKYYIPELKADHITGNSGTKIPVSLMLQENHMIVCTAGILLNEMIMHPLSNTKRVCLNDVSLLVIDECHNTRKNNPYAIIMESYIRSKLKGTDNLPQILGLTASPGAGDSTSGEEEKTFDHLQGLCALLDAFGGIKVVRDNIIELVHYTNQPDFDLLKTKPRSESDQFLLLLNSTMEAVEDSVLKIDKIDLYRSLRCTRGYEGQITQLLRDSEHHTGPFERDIRRHLKHLQYYYKALNVYQDLTQADAVALLQKKITIAEEPTPLEQSLHTFFEQFCQQALEMAVTENPKLLRLEQLLKSHFQALPTTRGIIFVTLKDSARCMCQWIKESKELKSLVRPGVVTGHGSNEQGGMSVLKQQDIIKQFEDGTLNLLVSTSALEEGLNVPACNLVVRYNYVTDEIARVQAQGHARAKGSRCYSILEESSPKVYREKLNKEREDLMMKALEFLPEGERLKNEIVRLQRDILSARDLQQQTKKDSKTLQSSQVVVVCKGCDLELCWGGDLRVLAGAQYIVITKGIFEKCIIKEHERSHHTGDFHITQKVYCKDCNQDLGVIMKWSEKNTSFPTIKCKQVLFCTPYGKNSSAKWSNVPFSIEEYS